MIQPLKCNSGNIKFCANEQINKKEVFKDFNQNSLNAAKIEETPKDSLQVNVAIQETPKEESVFSKIKHGMINVTKGFNTTTNTSAGFIKGLALGAAATGVVGVLGKNAKESKGQIVGTAVGVLKDIKNGAIKTIKATPSLITKAPIENAKTLLTLPKKFYKEYLKGNAKTAAIATAIGAGVLAYNTLKGKIIANKKNADVDHYTNTGHIKS